MPDIDKKMRMKVDVLDYTTGGVSSMECEDGLWRPVAFLSKSLNETMKFMTKKCWQLLEG